MILHDQAELFANMAYFSTNMRLYMLISVMLKKHVSNINTRVICSFITAVFLPRQ